MNSIRCLRGLVLALAVATLFTTSARADDHVNSLPEAIPHWPDAVKGFLDNDLFKISLNMRTRLEIADVEGLDQSEALTTRLRAGIGTKPLYGFTGFAELETTWAYNEGKYFDLVSAPNGSTPIADPEETALNQAWGQYMNEDFYKFKVKVGRQRIKVLDDRWIGNVGWRQNEQTYDSVLTESSFGIDGLNTQYIFIWDVRRIFGDQGPASRRDWNSQSHAITTTYSKLPFGASASAFAYLLDIDSSPGNSADTYGFRVNGAGTLTDDLKLLYVGSYAYQRDGSGNPVDYDAHYANAELGLSCACAGSFKVGYELLGSDDGNARVVTPLATAHKFNGFADVFLNNGGTNGLQDLYVTVSPKLPFGLKGLVTYHHFWSDENGNSLGDEVDVVLKRAFGKHFEVLTKGAYFIGDGTSSPSDIWRWWLDFTVKF